MSRWGRSEFRPGSDESLDELYALVPVAEEVDLAEELHAEQFVQWVERLIVGQLHGDEPLGGIDDPAAADSTGVDDAPTPGQALGLLEHLLGAVPIEE